MDQISIHYAFQACDIKSFQGLTRFCGDDRTELSKKSIKSLLMSIENCVEQQPNTVHHVAIIDDHSSDALKEYHKKCQQEFAGTNIKIDIISLDDKQGIAATIGECYHWLSKNGKDLVFQVQDDYMFTTTAIYEMIDLFMQIRNETGSDCVVNPWNDPWLWKAVYRNKPTPRTVIIGSGRYWIQYYDMSCSFMTSHTQFEQHWDLYNMFLFLTGKLAAKDKKFNGTNDLENRSLNYMFTQRNVLGLVPVDSLAFHMQSDLELDPHQDWRPIWDSIDVT